MSSTLRIRTVRVADSVKLEHVQIMQGHKGSAPLPAIYTLTRTPTQARIIPQGVLNHTETDLFHGFIPQCIIFGLVRNDAFNGNLARNPFNFELFDLQNIRLTVNGEEMPYSVLDLTGGTKIDGYNTLFSGSGDMNCGHGLDIDRVDWVAQNIGWLCTLNRLVKVNSLTATDFLLKLTTWIPTFYGKLPIITTNHCKD